MKNVLTLIWKFVNSKFFGYALVVLLLMFLAGQCKHNNKIERDNTIKDQNIAAATATINSYIDKEKNYVAEKEVWILTEKQLKKEKKELYDKVVNQHGDIISLNNAVLQLKQDTAILHDSIRYLKTIIGDAVEISKNKWTMNWQLDYKWDKKNSDSFKGHTIVSVDSTFKVTHINTLLDYRLSNIDLDFGEKVVDGKYNVYITSKYPGLTAKSLEGFFTDPNKNKDIQSLIEKQHWFTGLAVGPAINLGYDFFNNKPSLIIGAGLQYNIYQW